MRLPADHPLRTLVATTLVVCVSMCCCQLHIVLAVLGGGADGRLSAAFVCADTQSSPPCCCTRSDTPQQSEEDSDQAECCLCCIKGLGPKDTSVPALAKIDAQGLVALPSAWPASTGPALAVGRSPVAPHRLSPPTLLRLHCALVI